MSWRTAHNRQRNRREKAMLYMRQRNRAKKDFLFPAPPSFIWNGRSAPLWHWFKRRRMFWVDWMISVDRPSIFLTPTITPIKGQFARANTTAKGDEA